MFAPNVRGSVTVKKEGNYGAIGAIWKIYHNYDFDLSRNYKVKQIIHRVKCRNYDLVSPNA